MAQVLRPHREPDIPDRRGGPQAYRRPLQDREAHSRRSPKERQRVRRHEARPIVASLRARLEQQLASLPGKAATALAISYALTRWPALERYLRDGTVEIDNNAAERAIRPVALGRKN
ncbi:MAG: transposase [Pseudomonadota bacterium]